MNDDMGLLRQILKMVGTAPESQLRIDLAERARNMANAKETTIDGIHQFFGEIANLSDVDASSFVRQLVNPKFTKDYK